jgi:hypothetical protein
MNITPNYLHEFTGTENYFKTMDKSIVYTDGVQYFARNAGDQGAYWLLDMMVFEIIPQNRTEEFIAVKFMVENGKGTIRATDGNDEYLYKKHILYTDLANGEWIFFIENGECGGKPVKVILLPSEH